MKKYKFIAYLISILIILILSVTIYTSIAKSGGVDERNKTVSEIKYLEEKLIYIANKINNIENGNYSIKIGKLQIKNEENSTGSKSSGEEKSDKSGQSQEENSAQAGNLTKMENSSKSEQ